MTNKPEILAYFISHRYKWGTKRTGVRLLENHDPSCLNEDWNYDPLVRLSDYQRLQADHERLQAGCEKLRKASSELANWCFHEVGVDIELTPGLKQVMDITGDAYGEE